MARARRCLRAVVQSQVSRKDCIDALVRSMIFVWALALTGLALGAHLVSQPRKAKAKYITMGQVYDPNSACYIHQPRCKW